VSIRAKLAKPLNDALRPLHVQLVSGTSPDPAVQDFISARKTIAAAQGAGLPLGTYIDQTYAQPGTTPNTVKAMLELASLGDTCERVCEIGPGSGRYAEEVIANLHPGAYEIYETAKDWLPYLRKLPNAVIRDCDGHTLAQTRSASVDLVHAQKVFVYLEFYATAGYLDEMARVVRPGGAVAFDVVTEASLDDKTIEAWTKHGTIYHPVSRVWVVEFLQRRGLTLSGSYFAPLTPPATTELLVFRRE
jgi:ubiquinone/menaquinone biosynthesis C-methylase UbiE